MHGKDLTMIFTKNFMRTWMNHLSKSDRYLHAFAKQIVCLYDYPFIEETFTRVSVD
jgi:hypothetical protein